MRQGGERSRQVQKRQGSTAWKSELAEINAKARQEGMSYGYMAILVIRIIFTVKVSRANSWLMKIRFADMRI